MATLSPESAVYALLTADTSYNTLVAGRYYPRVNVPQQPTEPFMTHFRVSADHQHHFSASSGQVRVRVQVEHWATGYDQARALGQYAREALDSYSGTVTSGANSLAIGVIYLEDEGDIFDEDLPGSEAYVPGLRQDYIVWHSETVPTFT